MNSADPIAQHKTLQHLNIGRTHIRQNRQFFSAEDDRGTLGSFTRSIAQRTNSVYFAFEIEVKLHVLRFPCCRYTILMQLISDSCKEKEFIKLTRLFDGFILTCQQTLGRYQFHANRIGDSQHCLHIEKRLFEIDMWTHSHGDGEVGCDSVCVRVTVFRLPSAYEAIRMIPRNQINLDFSVEMVSPLDSPCIPLITLSNLNF